MRDGCRRDSARRRFCEGRLTPKRCRVFARWARRCKYGARARYAGELVQDRPQELHPRRLHPKGVPRRRVYARATVGNARRFLLDLLDTLPFPLLSVQVDGASEFMVDFERANRSARAEFWSLYDGPLTVYGITLRLNEYEFFYSYQGPHASLVYRTPDEYLCATERPPDR